MWKKRHNIKDRHRIERSTPDANSDDHDIMSYTNLDDFTTGEVVSVHTTCNPHGQARWINLV